MMHAAMNPTTDTQKSMIVKGPLVLLEASFSGRVASILVVTKQK
jgi:hypothetical protein